jgi:hypothetical protein
MSKTHIQSTDAVITDSAQPACFATRLSDHTTSQHHTVSMYPMARMLVASSHSGRHWHSQERFLLRVFVYSMVGKVAPMQ